MMRNRQAEKGFTLIEVVVVVAVIAILAAILTPFITKYIDDSKVAKAKNETQVIGAAVINAYKDLGRWPNRQTAVANYPGLYTGTTAPNAAFFGTATGWAAAGGANWNQLETHIATTAAAHGYPTTGDNKWSGPYAANPIPQDPWTRPYVINAAQWGSTTAPAQPVWVLSAGKNGLVETNVNATPQVTTAGGDDIAFRIQ